MVSYLNSLGKDHRLKLLLSYLSLCPFGRRRMKVVVSLFPFSLLISNLFNSNFNPENGITEGLKYHISNIQEKISSMCV